MSDPDQALQQRGDGAPSEMSTREFSRKEVELLKRTIAQDATDTELSMFIQNCKRYGLDPFTGQIHAVKRWDSNAGREVMSVQVGIDGFRLIADRTGKWRGTVGPYWCDSSGEWTDVWLQDQYPAAAKVGVLRSDFDEPRWGIARWDAYVATKKGGDPQFMWRKMPAHMLAKCAEALALRSAFPNDLSGLYTDAEMDQAGGNEKRTYDGPDPHEVSEAEVVTEKVEAYGHTLTPQQAEKLQKRDDALMEREGKDLAAAIASVEDEMEDWPSDRLVSACDEMLETHRERLQDHEAEAQHGEREDPDEGPKPHDYDEGRTDPRAHMDDSDEKTDTDSDTQDADEVKEAAESVDPEEDEPEEFADADADLPF
jgi:phage recombination protein Bet